MNRYIYAGILALSSLAFVSCSDDEELLEPSTGNKDNRFVVPADATGPEADLRREFYKSTGINLIFSDLLDREYVGKDAFGEDVWKDYKVDFGYNLTSTDLGNPPIITELTSLEEKSEGVDFIKEYILPHIAGTAYNPFSILISDCMQVYDSWDYVYEDALYTSCWNCTALAVGGVSDMTEDEKRELASRMLMSMVKERFNQFSRDLDPFYELSYEYDYEYLIDYDPNWDRTDLSVLYELGYFTYFESWRGPERDYIFITVR